MSRYLLDVNVLIALIDPDHESYERAHGWFADGGGESWLSSPTTQNGALRVVSHPRYPNSQPMAVVMASLASLFALPGHQFVADSESLFGSLVDRSRVHASSQVTDTSLLALAVSHGAMLATLDRRLVTVAVRGGSTALHLVGPHTR